MCTETLDDTAITGDRSALAFPVGTRVRVTLTEFPARVNTDILKTGATGTVADNLGFFEEELMDEGTPYEELVPASERLWVSLDGTESLAALTSVDVEAIETLQAQATKAFEEASL
jgi:hypothetical protein